MRFDETRWSRGFSEFLVGHGDAWMNSDVDSKASGVPIVDHCQEPYADSILSIAFASREGANKSRSQLESRFQSNIDDFGWQHFRLESVADLSWIIVSTAIFELFLSLYLGTKLISESYRFKDFPFDRFEETDGGAVSGM